MSAWETVTVLRKQAPTGAQARSSSVINAAKRQGLAVEVSKKSTAVSNAHAHIAASSAAKLDKETEDFHSTRKTCSLRRSKLTTFWATVERVPLQVSKVIQQARAAKGLTQKELATVSTSLCL